ncbi:hypothetical protein E4T50_05727 [Aureobasidium sp. EXF-12298]|nr:hypothetical protein E4T50_05727 [Aureobasidium sp. EXF-12298]KAI4758425.1 hypothetical protein E4T51_08524 [Aureobasidium sp. EXF-12344]KAI4782662.1 hypothetical protein E4T52_02370 [Aureobasidium sp. EXF-3400]
MATLQDNDHAKDVEVAWDDVREELHQYLDEIKGTGRFATMRRLDQIVDPQVRLLGIDDTPGHGISIPLGSRDALKLIEAAHQAPFGKGEETIVDTSVRNTWELSPDRFSLGEHWQSYVDSITTLACSELGVKGDGIHAELYKMLLYEGGAMFKQHADSEKTPGMFGTLVVSLPSAHWGGAVVVSHNGQRCLLQTHNHEYLACQEVTSGYRWVLTYNLIQTDYEHFNSTASAEQKLRGILTEWNKINKNASGEADRIIYQLDHKYTDASIRLHTLKGSDLLKAQRLFSVGNQMGYALYLASLEKQVHGSAESGYHGYRSRYDDEEEGSDGEFHAIEDVLEESLTLTRVVDPDGLVVITDLAIEEEDILQEEPYEDRDPDEHEYEGWTGNAGATSTHWYKDSALVLVPNECIADVFLWQHDPGYGTGGDTKILSVLRHLVKRARDFPDLQGEPLQKSLRHLCRVMSDNCSKATYPGARAHKYTDTTISEAITVCAEFGLTDVLPGLSSAFKDSLSESALRSLSNLKYLMNLKLPEDRTRLETIFEKVVLGYPRIIPNVERQMQGSDPAKTSFMTAFLAKLFERSESLTENLLSIYRPLVKIVANNFSLRKPQPIQPRHTSTYGAYGAYGVSRIQDTRKPALDGQVLANVLGHVMDLQLNEYGRLPIARVKAETATMDPEDCEHTILPFLKGIIMRLIDGKDEIAMYEDLFQTCLAHPVDRVKQIRVSKQRRHHLHSQLDAYTDCTHITERGYIETMVVTKQGKSFEEKLRTWTNKAKSALAALRSLEDQEGTSSSPSQLRKLLGDKYFEIMALRTVRIMTAAPQQLTQSTQTVVASLSASNAATAGASTSAATQSDIPQVAGRKRKAVVIDLTDD